MATMRYWNLRERRLLSLRPDELHARGGLMPFVAGSRARSRDMQNSRRGIATNIRTESSVYVALCIAALQAGEGTGCLDWPGTSSL
jgi:hypothetical protein